MRRGWFVPAGALAVLGGVVLAAGPAAGASTATAHSAAARHSASRHFAARHWTARHRAHRFVVRPGGVVRHLTGPAGVRRATSANWSGYALHGGTYRSVSAHWTEPRARCKAGDGHDYSSFWVGLDGYGSSTVEQTGTDTDCKGVTPKYYAWYEMYPAGSVRIRHRVRPGDHLSASTVWNGGRRFTLKLTDHSRGWTATEHRKLASATRASAEIIVEAPSSLSGELPLANFGTVHFTGSKVNGAKIGSRHPTKITMVVRGRQLDRVSALSSGASFSATFLHR
jgi:hypothetical protein